MVLTVEIVSLCQLEDGDSIARAVTSIVELNFDLTFQRYSFLIASRISSMLDNLRPRSNMGIQGHHPF